MSCELCGDLSILENSHYIPAALYKLCLSEGSRGAPVIVSNNTAVATSNQITKNALCAICEGKFQKSEAYVLSRIYRGKGEFKLREQLAVSKPLAEVDGGRLFLGSQVSDFDADLWIQFALSIYWRGSAIRWPGFDNGYYGALGPYEKSIRSFFVDRARLGNDFVLTMFVDDRKEPFIAGHFPVMMNEHPYHIHDLLIPGVRFRLYVGKNIPAPFRKFGSGDSPDVCIAEGSFDLSGLTGLMVDVVKQTKPKGKLARLGLRNYGDT